MACNRKEYLKEYREKNKEKQKAYMKEYRSRFAVKKRSKEYHKKYDKKYYQKNKENILDQMKIYQQKNKEKIGEQRKEYNSRPEVKTEVKKYMKEYNSRPEVKKVRRKYEKRLDKKIKRKEYRQRSENKLRKKEYMKEWREKNKKYFNEMLKKYNKERRKIDLNFRIRINLRTRVWSVLKYYTKTGKIMSSKKYGIDYGAIIEYLKPFPENISNYHVDHIKPLCSFDLTNLEEIKIAFAPENHQWLTIKENLEKGSKLVMPCAFK